MGTPALPITRTSSYSSADTTGSSAPDSATGSLAFADVDLSDTHTVTVSVNSALWSGDPDGFVPSNTLADLQTALTTALNDSSGAGSGSIDWTFSIPDSDLDFLADGQTLTIVYDVTVSDGFTTSTQQVTITATGAVDNQIVVNPRISADNIAAKIDHALARQAHREAHNIQVIVDGASVTLRGQVHSWAEWRAAQGVAWSAPGIATVNNDLLVVV